jgi:hypothetical protein
VAPPTSASSSEIRKTPSGATPTAADTPPAAAPTAKARRGVVPGTVVAVFDIIDSGGRFPSTTLDQLSDYLTAQLTAVGQIKVVPRDQLRRQLVERKRESYKACYSSSCQIELGRAVAAEKTLTTKLLRVGTRCAVTAVLYDLKTETTDHAATLDTTCAEDALLDAMKRIAQGLAGR